MFTFTLGNHRKRKRKRGIWNVIYTKRKKKEKKNNCRDNKLYYFVVVVVACVSISECLSFFPSLFFVALLSVLGEHCVWLVEISCALICSALKRMAMEHAAHAVAQRGVCFIFTSPHRQSFLIYLQATQHWAWNPFKICHAQQTKCNLNLISSARVELCALMAIILKKKKITAAAEEEEKESKNCSVDFFKK